MVVRKRTSRAVDPKVEAKLENLIDRIEKINEIRKTHGNERDAYDDLAKLLEHAGAVDEVMTSVRSFTVVGRILRKSLLWMVSTVGAIIVFISFLKGGVGWLVEWGGTK